MSGGIGKALAGNTAFVGGVLVVGAAAFLYWKFGSKLKKVVTETLNPASDKNVIYDGIVGGVGRAISGDPAWSLGTWAYDFFHKELDPSVGPVGANLAQFIARAPLKVQDRPNVVR